jgi:hypothetical protein
MRFAELLEVITRMLNIFTRGAFLQGTYEAAIVEAQGATWVGGGARDHLTELVEIRQALLTLEQQITMIVNQLGLNAASGGRLNEILENNLFKFSRTFRDIITQTESLCAQLRTTDATRLQGVSFFEGGAGPNVQRTVGSLPSQQLQQTFMRSQLAPGVEPTIVRSGQPAFQQVLNSIRTLPVTFDDLKRNVQQITGSLIAAIRLWMSQTMAAANAALRAGMLLIEEAIVEMGSRLTTPIIIIGNPFGQPGPIA